MRRLFGGLDVGSTLPLMDVGPFQPDAAGVGFPVHDATWDDNVAIELFSKVTDA